MSNGVMVNIVLGGNLLAHVCPALAFLIDVDLYASREIP